MKIKNLFIALLASLTFFISCSDGDDNNGDMGKLTVQITDAPFPHDLVAEVNVTIFKIDARNKGKEMEMDEMEVDSESTDEEYDHSPFVTLMEEEIEMNLLELTNGVTETLVNTDVPVGTYDLFRIYVKGVSLVLTDGTTYDLKVPSGEQTGIKVFIKPGLVVSGGLSADLLLDFDVSKSFVPKGNRNDLAGIKGFNFKPVIKASNRSTAGTLSGVVYTTEDENQVGLGGAQIAVYADDTFITSAFSEAETGAYMVMGLEAGTYDVVVELNNYEMQTAEDVGITAANKTTDVGITAANKTTMDFELIAIP